MRVLTVLVLVFSVVVLWAYDEEVPGSAEEVPVPSFIDLNNVDLSKAPEQHTVVTGDTLWDISETYLKSPWYWPKVWSLNPQISNPHLIYPGNIISFRHSGEIEMPNGELNGGLTAGDTGDEIGETDEAARTGQTLDAKPTNYKHYVKLGGRFRPDRFVNVDDTLFDVTMIGFIGDMDWDKMGTVVGAFESKEMLAEGDSTYVKLGEKEFGPGDKVEFILEGKKITHPITGEKLGFSVTVHGYGKVVDVTPDNIATVQITKSFLPILRKMKIREYHPIPKTVKLKETNFIDKAYIVAGVGLHENYGESYTVYLDKGSDDGLELGNMLTVYTRGDGLNYINKHKKKTNFPWEPIGDVVVINVSEKTSVAIITKSIVALVPGDIVTVGNPDLLEEEGSKKN